MNERKFLIFEVQNKDEFEQFVFDLNIFRTGEFKKMSNNFTKEV